MNDQNQQRQFDATPFMKAHQRTMKNKLKLHLLFLALLSAGPLAYGQGTAFTVQGRLNSSGAAANGGYEMRFTTYAVQSGGQPVATFIPPSPISVADGLFNAKVDFGGGVFNGTNRWMEISVRPAGDPTFTVLSNRIELTSSPYAVRSLEAASLSSGALTASQLHIAGAPPSAGQVLGFNGSDLVWTTTIGGGTCTCPWSLVNNDVVYYNGNVGIGTVAVQANLHVFGGTSTSHLIETAGDTNAWARVQFKNLNGQWDIGTSRSFNGDQFYIFRQGASFPAFAVQPNGDASTLGKLGVGIGVPAVNLDVRGSGIIEATVWSTSERAILSLHNTLPGGERVWTLESGLYGDASLFGIYDRTANRAGLTIDTAGNVGMGGVLHPSARLEIAGPTGSHTFIGVAIPGFAGTIEEGDLHVDGKATVCTLTINGGCDLAEPFPIAEPAVEKGSVLVIDDDHPGQLALSTRAYDTRVAGVLSGANGINPGIALKQAGVLDSGENVALSGRVYVQADASYGPIKPGDLLTTSDTPGHAMRVRDHAKAQGAVLGKAMSSLTKNKGLVLVLVTLQ